VIEVYEYYEPKLQFFAEWLKQLFGESEGKDGKGIFPSALQFTTDLHSMGQFLQEGTQIFFETVLNVLEPPGDLMVPESAGELLAGKSMNAINQAAVEGVMAAHEAAGVPIIKLDIPELSPHCFGQMVYFFETVCALSGYLNGVNPFDQPGVESYKAEMRKVLKSNT
jgi:glucose-6-phosphate isomerase